MDAILLYNGFAIKLETEQYSIRSTYKVKSSGVLSYFEINSTKYEFFSIEDFIKSDRDYKTAVPGYYDIEYFASYRRRSTTLANLNKHGLFDLSNFEFATQGDLVEVKRLDPKPDFTDYYFNTTFKFKIYDTTGNGVIKQYKKISDFPPINTDINSPEYSISESLIRYPHNSFTKLYYAKNLGDFIDSWQIADDIIEEDIIIEVDDIEDEEKTKKQYARLMTYVCWKIFYIHKNILNFLAITDLSFIKDFYASKLYLLEFPDTTDTTIRDFADSYDGLPLVDKTIAELMHQWGIIKFHNSSLVSDFPQTFDNTVLYDDIYDYYRSLVHFYESLRYQKEYIIFPSDNNDIPVDYNGVQITEEQNSDRRIKYLINLSTTSLLTLPYESRLNILKDFIKESELSEGEQRTVVRLLHSFQNEEDADNILDFFLLRNDGVTTNFENLYNKLDDARLERYAIINWFVDHQTNKKFFIYLLYETWKISKYNFAFVPDGELPNFEGSNPNGFFLPTGTNGGEQYMPQYNEDGELTSGAETLLEFKTLSGIGSSTTFSTHLSTTISYKPKEIIDRHIVTLNKLTTEKTFNAFAGINNGGNGISQFTTSQKFGEYHLYQPISLLGYEENLNLKVPDIDAIPVFLFYYAEEFDRIYDLDATINFVGEVVLEVGLFFLFGGAGTLRHLQHFRKLTKLRHLKPTLNAQGVPVALELVGVSANESLIVYKAFSSTTEVVSVSASILMSFFNLQGTLTNNSEEEEAYKKIANVFMYMAIATGVGSGLSRVKANKIADDVLDNTSPSALSQFPEEIIDVLRDLRSKKTNILLNFGTILDDLNVAPPNLLGAFYNTLDNLPEIKDLFYRDFNKLTDVNLWNRFNNTDIINRWQQMAELGIAERVNLNILEDVASANAIVRYYGEDALKNVLEGLSFEKRWAFLNNFGTQSDEWFSVLTTKPEAINRWQNLTGRGKQAAKNYPEDWLNVYDNAYTLKTKREKIPDIELVALFEQRGLNLVNDVEIEALNYYNNLSGKKRSAKVLVAGGKNLDEATILRTNLTDKELTKIVPNDGRTAYQKYYDEMQPNLKKRVDKIKEFSDFDAGRPNYHVNNSVTYPDGRKYNVKQAGNFPGAHAEVQVVNDLAIAKWGNMEVSEEVFSNWLKNDVLIYNRNISVKQAETKVIMHTCIDCFNILPEVTFINRL